MRQTLKQISFNCENVTGVKIESARYPDTLPLYEITIRDVPILGKVSKLKTNQKTFYDGLMPIIASSDPGRFNVIAEVIDLSEIMDVIYLTAGQEFSFDLNPAYPFATVAPLLPSERVRDEFDTNWRSPEFRGVLEDSKGQSEGFIAEGGTGGNE